VILLSISSKKGQAYSLITESLLSAVIWKYN